MHGAMGCLSSFPLLTEHQINVETVWNLVLMLYLNAICCNQREDGSTDRIFYELSI